MEKMSIAAFLMSSLFLSSQTIVHRVEATGTFHYSTPNRIESITFNYTTN